MNVIDGEIALVTGASRGIGRAILMTLGRAGATVIGTATNEHGAAGIDSAIAEAGLKGKGIVLDVRQSNQIDAAIDHVQTNFGGPGILVNNAGVTRDNLLARMKDDEWNEILETDLTSVFRLSRAVLRGMMKARRGRIINIGSVVGFSGNAGQTNYAAAKAGLVGFSKALAREVGSRGITVNTIAPGFIETDMTKGLSQEQVGKLVENVPLGRLGSVDDIAQAALFLASPGAGYITGSTIHVNGGMYM